MAAGTPWPPNHLGCAVHPPPRTRPHLDPPREPRRPPTREYHPMGLFGAFAQCGGCGGVWGDMGTHAPHRHHATTTHRPLLRPPYTPTHPTKSAMTATITPTCTTPRPATSSERALVSRIGELAEACDRYGATEADLLDMDELLNELLDSPGCGGRFRTWVERRIDGICTRLDTEDWDL